MIPTTPDYRALCAELLQAWDDLPWEYDFKGDLVGPFAGIDDTPFERARAALAQPEGPTDKSTHKHRWPVHLSRRQREMEVQKLCSQAGIDGAQQQQLRRNARDGVPLQDIIELIDFTVAMRQESTIAELAQPESIQDRIAKADAAIEASMERIRAIVAPASLALAQPGAEGPTDEELDSVFHEHCWVEDDLMDHDDFVRAARAVLARYGRLTRPKSMKPTAWLYLDGAIYDGRHWYDQWRITFDKKLALFKSGNRKPIPLRGRPVITPIPVSERLPGAEDCWPDGHDKVGCCWLWAPDECLGRWEVQYRDWASDIDGEYTHWLPFYALPLPSPNCPQQP